jgi:hypothetical protein
MPPKMTDGKVLVAVDNLSLPSQGLPKSSYTGNQESCVSSVLTAHRVIIHQ